MPFLEAKERRRRASAGLIAGGIVIGLGIALLLSRELETLLFGVAPGAG